MEKWIGSSQVAPAKRKRPTDAGSSAEAFAARTTRRRVGILDLESAVLQRVDVVQFAPGHVKGALRIDHHPDAAGFHEDIAAGRAVLQIHLVLQTGAAAADHGHAQNALGPALFAEERIDLPGCVGRDFDEPLVANAKARSGGGGLVGCGGNHSSYPPRYLESRATSISAADLLPPPLHTCDQVLQFLFRRPARSLAQ